MSSTSGTTLPDGTSVTRIKCHYSMDNCYRAAEDLCGGEYEVLKSGETGHDLVQLNASSLLPSPADTSTATHAPVFTGVLNVRCK